MPIPECIAFNGIICTSVMWDDNDKTYINFKKSSRPCILGVFHHNRDTLPPVTEFPLGAMHYGMDLIYLLFLQSSRIDRIGRQSTLIVLDQNHEKLIIQVNEFQIITWYKMHFFVDMIVQY